MIRLDGSEICRKAETWIVYGFQVSLSLFVAGNCGNVSGRIQENRIKIPVEEAYCVSLLRCNHNHMGSIIEAQQGGSTSLNTTLMVDSITALTVMFACSVPALLPLCPSADYVSLGADGTSGYCFSLCSCCFVFDDCFESDCVFCVSLVSCKGSKVLN